MSKSPIQGHDLIENDVGTEVCLPERPEQFDEADRGKANLTDRFRCALDGRELPRAEESATM